jgi:hypothetical protein
MKTLAELAAAEAGLRLVERRDSNVESGNVKMKCRHETVQEHQRSDADRVVFMFSAVEDRRPTGRWRRGGVTQSQRRIRARR